MGEITGEAGTVVINRKPNKMHNKLTCALSCGEYFIYINDIRVTMENLFKHFELGFAILKLYAEIGKCSLKNKTQI